MQDLVIIGAGSHGKGIKTIIDAINEIEPTYNFLGFLDDDYKTSRIRAIGPPDIRLPSNPKKVAGTNNSETRARIYKNYCRYSTVVLVHPTVIFGTNTVLKEGTVIHAGVIITGNVYIEENVHVNVGCTISQGTCIGSHTSIAPGVNIAGEVMIGERCQIGTGVSISNLVHITNDVIIGAGAVVVDDVTKPGTYVGAPARRIEKNV